MNDSRTYGLTLEHDGRQIEVVFNREQVDELVRRLQAHGVIPAAQAASFDLSKAIAGINELINAAKKAKRTLDADIPDGDPVHPVSASLTFPLSSAMMARDQLAALTAPPSQEAGLRRSTPEEDAKLDASLDLECLPPIRLPVEVVGIIKKFAELEGVIVQALVRDVLTERFSAPAQEAGQAMPESDLRELRKWLNEEPNRPLDRAALARLIAAYESGLKSREKAVPEGYVLVPIEHDVADPHHRWGRMCLAAGMALRDPGFNSNEMVAAAKDGRWNASNLVRKIVAAAFRVAGPAAPQPQEKKHAELSLHPDHAEPKQQRELAGAVEVGQLLGGGSNKGSGRPETQGVEHVAVMHDVDEYGPILHWNRHWATFNKGTRFYLAAPELDRLKVDAERYRWLRDVSVPPHNFYLSVPVEFDGVRYTPAEVDAAIDAAIQAAAMEKKV